MAILRSSATRIGCTALSIPTCSGISHFHQLRRILRTVAPRHWSAWLYPRSRGENTLRTNDLPAVYGSSPLTRGKLWNLVDEYGNRGLIPAHAGKTTCPRTTVVSGGAHPRSRGENASAARHWASSVGSSPLTRGKLCRGNGPRSSRRLIPAHAGKTILTVAGAIFAQAHPRSRGENRSGGGVAAAFGGLIPAHAGKTSRERAAICSFQAHPRSRGENLTVPAPPGLVRGSSPLTWGKRERVHQVIVTAGLIPAHVGKT